MLVHIIKIICKLSFITITHYHIILKLPMIRKRLLIIVDIYSNWHNVNASFDNLNMFFMI